MSTSTDSVAPDTAALLAMSFESCLYGFSVWMFSETMRELLFGGNLNRKMAIVASMFFMLSTAHVIVDLIRLKIGFIDLRDTYRGGPSAYFSSATEPMFLLRSAFYLAQTLLADAVLVYRCHTVWCPVSKWVMLFPLSLWLGMFATSLGAFYNLGVATKKLGGAEIFAFAKWINGFFGISLATNLIGTALLGFRIWKINQTASQFRNQGFMIPVLRVVIDAGMLYSVTLTVTLITFEVRSNAQTICLDMLMPIIAISFYMIILRVAKLAERAPPKNLANNMDISLQPTFSITSRWSTSPQRQQQQQTILPEQAGAGPSSEYDYSLNKNV
ncbi:hypothetical protein K435DRAFT_720256 [Dendrothele bispora CBS 962.96]|uniref:Uncharacterized protein n=1 Tax=Dendrothele bispora (strain CBS 962.96) TaxID=1314807 RepID=A0A4S8M9I0_DENBC|nr:hypothetical protein K435DRAFT_720256 [Dendrothele bispora CBS 962.96]